MAYYQISISDEQLHGLLQGDRGLADLVQAVLNQVLQAQATDCLKAEPYQRTEERLGYRNGVRDRSLTTRVGSITLEVPQFREGKLPADLFERYQRSETALITTLMEMVVNGVSTRKIRNITKELCGAEFSKSTVSDLAKGLDPAVHEWNERSLDAEPYPFLIVDAIVIKIRKSGRVRNHSTLIATGINSAGAREILGLRVADGESEDSWREFFGWLKARGLHGVDLVVSDNHGGLVNAVAVEFQGASWQRCQTHFTKNILDACPKSVQKDLHARLRLMFEAPDMNTARELLGGIINDFSGRAPNAIDRLEAGFEDAMAVMALPECLRKRLRTSNCAERLNEEVRRRERVIRIFPNEASALRLIGAVLMELDEAWSTNRRYLNMDEYWRWKQESVLGQGELLSDTAQRAA
ncbi:MAG: Transposase, Mutator family [Firmicutes bacterium ADurb.Bin506]|jgi:transposase-like protein|nr:MAG: Transposase, Mutator family [Firmicutes bacterium ADurb.Bin506]